jgi:hypothetical protein
MRREINWDSAAAFTNNLPGNFFNVNPRAARCLRPTAGIPISSNVRT